MIVYILYLLFNYMNSWLRGQWEETIKHMLKSFNSNILYDLSCN